MTYIMKKFNKKLHMYLCPAHLFTVVIAYIRLNQLSSYLVPHHSTNLPSGAMTLFSAIAESYTCIRQVWKTQHEWQCCTEQGCITVMANGHWGNGA